MKLGVCYYPEQWPENRWPLDARLMVESGFEMVRIGEFAWAKMEPQPGTYDWDWLDEAIDTLAGAGLEIILGTPTATPPAWLTANHPDINRVDANGRRRRHGSRRHACVNHPVYHRESERIVRAMGERYGNDPRIIGWQIDNEFGGGRTGRCYCQTCAGAFHEWLHRRYGDLNQLNDAWGTVFWSQTYTDWDQIQVPDEAIDKPNPSQQLDYYRFCSDTFVAYQQLQIDVLRPLTSGFITHNFMGIFRELDQFDLARSLDFVTWDNYPTGNPERWRRYLYPPGREIRRNDPIYAYDAGEPVITGMAHALTRGLKQRPFWIMEQQCGLINWGEINPGIRPGTTRLWTWHALAEGAEACVYFRWRPTRFAQEQYHSGILRHDGEPAQGLRDVLSLRKERDLMAAIAAEPFVARVALLVGYDDLWAMEIQPQRDGYHYLRQHFVFYEALQKMGVAVDLVPYDADLTRYSLVLAPTIHLPDGQLVESLRSYVERGGTLLIGVRSGFKTSTNLVTDLPLPGLLVGLTGALVTSWQSLPDESRVEIQSSIPNLQGPATYWFETLQPVGATPLAAFATGETALTENPIGNGQVITLGWFPTTSQARGLLNWLLRKADITDSVEPPPGCLAYRRGRYTIVLNFTDSEREMIIDGEPVSIGPRDVIVRPT